MEHDVGQSGDSTPRTQWRTFHATYPCRTDPGGPEILVIGIKCLILMVFVCTRISLTTKRRIFCRSKTSSVSAWLRKRSKKFSILSASLEKVCRSATVASRFRCSESKASFLFRKPGNRFRSSSSSEEAFLIRVQRLFYSLLLSQDFLIERILALFGRIGILDFLDSLSDFMADQIAISSNRMTCSQMISSR